MCVVSMVSDHYSDIFKKKGWDWKKVDDFIPMTPLTPDPYGTKIAIDELCKQMNEMIELLKKAKIYDKENNEPNCEKGENIELIKLIAKKLEINLEDVL